MAHDITASEHREQYQQQGLQSTLTILVDSSSSVIHVYLLGSVEAAAALQSVLGRRRK
jgi:hypothetical protein